MRARETIVGVISDTHGLLRPQAITVLRGSHMILHAGDIGNSAIIDELRKIAPCFVVRGNIDSGRWAARLPITMRVEIGGHQLLLLHQISLLTIDAAAAGLAAVVFGHSHRASVETRAKVLFLNPGSAGPRRFNLPVSVARITVSGSRLRAEIVMLEV
jgi:putative phosphoesterase